MVASLQIIDFQSLSSGEVLPHTTWVRGGTLRTLPGTREVSRLVNGQTLSAVASLALLLQVFPTVTGQLGLESLWRLSQQQQAGPLGPCGITLTESCGTWLGEDVHPCTGHSGVEQNIGHPSLTTLGALGSYQLSKLSVSV